MKVTVMDVVSLFRTFTKLASARSISDVARKNGTSQSAVTRQIAALENHLGVRLLQITTRSLTLTEDGRELLAHASRILDAVEEAETSVGRRRKAPAGRVRIGVPNAFAEIYLLPKLPELLSRYPEISVEFVNSDGYQDLVSEGLDLWIRLGDVAASALITRSLGCSRRVAVATVGYLRRAGEPMHPTGLSRHECIIFTRRSDATEWTFQGRDGPVVVGVSGRVRTDSPGVYRDAVLRGLGIGMMPGWLIHEELRAGTVRAVLTGWELPRVQMHVVYPTRRLIPPRTRAVLDFLIEQARLDPAVSVLATAQAA
jgi:DNA-binding transcriptional LysR family regulator